MHQWECAQLICGWLERVLLVSQTQAGKTDTVAATVDLERWGVPREKVYFICGMNDVSLKSQAGEILCPSYRWRMYCSVNI